MTIAPNAIAFRSAMPIALDEALARFPSLAADTPSPKMSARYEHISTAETLRGLTGAGFEIFSIQTKRTLDEENRPYVKHAVRLRMPGAAPKALNDSVPEICFVNAHNGRSKAEFFAGLLRLICLNGLMVGTSFASFAVPHFGRDVSGRMLAASFGVVETFGPMSEQVQAMQAHLLSYDETQEFTARAMRLRYGDESPFSPASLDVRRRLEDSSVDLWTTFNRVQENLIRGGARGVTIGSNGRMRRTSMRAVNALDTSTKLNRGLWDLAAEFLPNNPRPALIAPETVI